MRPIDLTTDDTVEFILDHIPLPHVRILDIGCGEGLIASQLLARGHEVVAIDESAEMVKQAHTKGVDARVAAWPSFEETPFDVVLFVRSLHHLYPLKKAIVQAYRLLAPTGRVIVEDFAWEEVDTATAEWFYGIVRLLASSRVLSPDEDSFVAELAQSRGDFSFWQQSHNHELHTVAQMWSALRAYFRPLSESSIPYLYRYLCPVLADDEKGYDIGFQVYEMEKRLAQLGAIKLIGRRFVGIKM